MNAFIITLRAVGTTLAMRLYIPAVVAAGLMVVLLITGGVWLTALSQWWWLLLVPIVMITSIILGVAFVLYMLIRYVRPQQTKAQKQSVKQFVDKLQGVADIAGTPKFIVLFRVVRSIAAPSKDSYLSDIVATKALAHDFRELQRLFATKA